MPESAEAVLIEKLVAQTTVEALRVRVLDRLARPNEVMLDAALIGPRVEDLARELRSIVGANRARFAVELDCSIKDSSDPLSRQSDIEVERDTAP